jgi:hypothetical protein
MGSTGRLSNWVREVSSRDVQRVTENEELDIMDGSTASKSEEPTSSISVKSRT